MPESYLEDYFAIGYECYYVPFDKRVNIQKKVKVITSLFKDLIIFFNIDYNLNLPDFNWGDFIYDYIHENNNAASVGIMYTKRQTKLEKQVLERKYLYEMGIRCGCIQLEYQKAQNFELIGKILYANQAQGRRKNIRALCTSACTYTFVVEHQSFTGSLQDISVSHFSFISPENALNIQLYEKIKDFHFNIRGFLFRSDAVLIMQRKTAVGVLYVFGFTSSTGQNGLDNRIKQLLIPNIYKLMASNCKSLLEQIFNRVDNADDIAELQEVD